MAAYTVVAGDTLSAIAKAHGTTVQALLDLNPEITDPDVIGIGQSIVVSGDDAAGGTAAEDYTDESTTRFNGLPGKPEIWRDTDTGKVYVVYFPEGMDPPVPLRYLVTDDEVLKTYFGDEPVAYDHEYTGAEMDALGAVTFGDVGEIADTTGDPWSGFTIKMERSKKVMPWLDDPDVFAIFASAYLEGRVPELYEFAHTEWYRTHNQRERDWLTTVAQDPAQAEQQLEDDRARIRQKFLELGLAPPSEELVDYLTSKWTYGTWSETELDDQIAALSGGGEGVVLDAGLEEYAGTVGTATTMVDRVKELWAKWLGTAYAPTEAQIAEWAGILRDDEVGGEARLVEMLRGQRLALFPEYEDDTLTWSDISGPWKSMAYGVWGVEAQDDDEEFVDIVAMNDATEAKKRLRQIGLERGYEQVTVRARNALERGMRTGVRGVV